MSTGSARTPDRRTSSDCLLDPAGIRPVATVPAAAPAVERTSDPPPNQPISRNRSYRLPVRLAYTILQEGALRKSRAEQDWDKPAVTPKLAPLQAKRRARESQG